MDGEVYELLLRSAQEHGVLPLTSVCNVACEFCSNKQNPPEIRTYDIGVLDFEIIEEIVSFLQNPAKIIIGESATRINEGEPLTHPQFLSIAKMIRQKFPHATIQLTTNGNRISPELASDLSTLSPVELVLSLNSASIEGRERLMHDREAKTAVKAPFFLHMNQIPFHGSLVAQPSIVGWNDIERTIKMLSDHGAKTIRIFLPGYTRWYREGSQEMISSGPIMQFAREMTIRYGVPVLAEPPMLEDLNAVVEGTIRGSAADRCGIQPGDIIQEVNGIEVLSRFHAYELCQEADSPWIQINRGYQGVSIRLDKPPGESSGLVFYFDLDPSRFQAIRKRIQELGERILVLTSTLAFRTVSQAYRQWLPDLSRVRIQAVDNRYFGGTIRAAGLLMVEDFIATIQNLSREETYDVIMIPEEPFDHKGCDLVGRSYREIEVSTGCRVVLV